MNQRFPASLLLLLALFLAAPLPAAVKLPSIVGDGMVLQRDIELKIWGWADAGEKVTVTFRGKSADTTTDAHGRWQVKLPPQTAGGPDSLEISGSNKITLNDVLVGDVWICSGQSNMTHLFNRWQDEYATEIASSENPAIRQFTVPTKPVLTGPLDNIPDLGWKKATPKNLLNFTVIGYFFARQLHEKHKIPQGLILTAVGGTRIEAWTSEEGFNDSPDQLATIARNKDTATVDKLNAEAKADREADGPRVEADQGLTGPVKWFDPAYVPLNWKPITVPGFWEDQGVRLDGVVWYRREIEIPEAMAAGDVRVRLGRIQNADELYVNGKKVGNTTYEFPQRKYTIPAGTLKPGKNLFVVRVVNQGGKGGFIPDKPYYLEAGGQTIDLKGTWSYRVGEAYSPPSRQYKQGVNAQEQPASLYNGMIAPYVNYGIRGILWYQGEANAGNPEPYRKLLPSLIRDWRAHWGQGDVPFLIAQLPNYMEVDYLPVDSSWAMFRETQMDATRSTPNTGCAVALGLGEWNDIHPGNKGLVGERLALLARQLSYGEKDLVASGPIFRSQEIKDGKIVLTFDHIGGGLVTNNGEPPAHFAIAGEDKKFKWATAVIENNQVVVSRADMPAPKYVRYAWADNPDFANLSNKEGLPAAPFRTDR